MRYLLFLVLMFGAVSGNSFEEEGVLKGKLENGLTYYVKQNGYPEGDAYIELVVKVGSVYEREDELGYAHLVEHLVFRGSEHFKDNEVIRYMDSLGAWNGPDSNAETGFDSTKYHFLIPLDNKEALRKTLLILSDFAASATFAENVVQKEKGVVLDEFHRGNSDAEQQSFYRQLKEFLPFTPFAHHLPIGTEESIRNVTSAGLKKFYEKWYTPDRMAVIAVGNFEADHVVGIIKEIFEAIPAPALKTPEPIFEIKLPEKSKAVIHVDPELTETRLAIAGFEIDKSEWSVKDDFLGDILMVLLKNRFNEFISHNKGYFYSIDADGGFLGLDVAVLEIVTDIRENSREAVLMVVREIKKIEKNGFTKSELEGVRNQLRKRWNKALDNVMQTTHTEWSDDLENHFLHRWPIVSKDLVLKHHLRALDDISIEEINAFIKKSSDEVNMIFLSSPKTIQDLDEEGLLKLFNENVSSSGEIVSTELEKQYGITTWTLNNGISVSLKSTKLERQQVVMQALALGGFSSTESPKEYMTSQLLVPFTMVSGIGPFSYHDIQTLRENEKLYFNVSLEHDSREVIAQGHRQDFETIFELFHAFFAASSFNPMIWDGLNESMSTLTTQFLNEPAVRFNFFLDNVYSNENYRMQTFDSALTDQSLIKKLYDRFFGAPRVFHFSIVGDFNLNEVEPLVKKYLGALPDRSPEVLVSANILETPQESVRGEFKFGKISTTQTVIGFTYNVKDVLPYVKSRFVFNMMNYILQRRLQSLLREELGHTYHVDVDRYGPKDTNERNDILQISFTSQEDHRNSMIQHTLNAIEELKKGEISEEELSMARQTFSQKFKKLERSNSYWSTSINTAKIFSMPLIEFLNSESTISSITTDDVKEMIHKVFDEAHPSVFSHLPASP